MICAGIDAGSRTLKAVLVEIMDRNGASAGMRVIAEAVRDQQADQSALARSLLGELVRSCEVKPPVSLVATGYGRQRTGMDATTLTEITCQAVGVRRLWPEVRTIIDIGGQDCKVIALRPDGSVQDFTMNDRCAAGTGRFLEMAAQKLDSDLDVLGQLAQDSVSAASITTTCAVFAESEIIGLLAEGCPRADIAAGVQASIAVRIARMAHPQWVEPVVFTGGVARVLGMREALEAAIGRAVLVPSSPQTTAALGAAFLAADLGHGSFEPLTNQPADIAGNNRKSQRGPT